MVAASEPMIPREEIPSILRWEAIKQNKPKFSQSRLELLLGKKSAYSPTEIKQYLDSEAAVVPSTAPTEKLTIYRGPKEFPWISLRRSYRDVLTMEDPSLILQGEKGKNTFDDLDGALISYTRDIRHGTDTWSTEAAILAPFSWETGHTLRDPDFLVPARLGFIPSISYHRVSAATNPKGDIDQLIYRVGLFAKLESGNDFRQLNGLTLRAFGSYATDAEHDSAVPAGEFEIEPQSDLSKSFKIGYRTILIPKETGTDVHDTAWIAYQLRLLIHGEYVSIQNRGSNLALTEGDYFRVGPIVQLDFKPLVFTRLSFSLRYSYLPAFAGSGSAHDSLLTVDADWALVKDLANQRKLSLKVSYLDGGLDLTKERAETLLVGLGAAF